MAGMVSGVAALALAVLVAGLVAGCASGPRSASDCGFHFTSGTGVFGLLGAAGAFDRPAGPNCVLAQPSGAIPRGGSDTPAVPPAVEEPNTAIGVSPQFGQPVINSGDCIGAVVAGVCHGMPAPGAPTATCYGQMVGGVCTGPMF